MSCATKACRLQGSLQKYFSEKLIIPYLAAFSICNTSILSQLFSRSIRAEEKLRQYATIYPGFLPD